MMNKVIVQSFTTVNPLQLMGLEAGICWGTPTGDPAKDKKRGLECLRSGHGRVAEFPQIYLTIDKYSARCIRELYTHIGGAPTRLQASTRYIDYAKEGIEYIVPPAISKNTKAALLWDNMMNQLAAGLEELEEMGISKEDAANGLPLGMTTKIVFRTNLRNLIDMMHLRKCSRAYWEIRELMEDICEQLSAYSEEWAEVVNEFFVPKCEFYGWCDEKFSCGRKPAKLAK